MAMSEEERKRRHLESNRVYRAMNKEKVKASHQKYYAKNKDDPEFRAKHREGSRLYRDANREKTRETCRKYYNKNKDDPAFKKRNSAKSAKYINANKEKVKARQQAKYQRDPETAKKRSRKNHRLGCDNLSDSYIKHRLVDGCELTSKDIPQELIDAKRSYLKGIRLIKELENGERTTKD